MRRWLILIAGVAAVVGLFLLLRPTDEPSETHPSPKMTASPPPTTAATPSPTPTADQPDTVEIEVEEGRVQGPARIQVSQGDQVRLEVKADVADEVHVHVYDLMVDVSPDDPALVSFRADIPGIFEIELEGSGLLLTRLEVSA